MIKATFIDFYRFVRTPDDRQLQFNFGEKLRFTFIWFSTTVMIAFIFIIPLLHLIDASLDLTPTVDYNSSSEIQLFMSTVLVIPFLEELIFRHFLRYQGIKTYIVKPHQWKRIFPFLVYLTTLAFGFIHLINFTNDSNLFYILSPLVILAQLVSGFIIAFVRIRINFLWGVFFHCSWNFIFLFAIPALEEFLEIFL